MPRKSMSSLSSLGSGGRTLITTLKLSFEEELCEERKDKGVGGVGGRPP